jgi:Cu(I)/Ag(I) efflux system membrane fusion protein
MSRFAFSFAAAAALVFMSGCADNSTPGSDAGNRAAEGQVSHDHSHDGHSHDEHADHDHAADADIEAALAKLSPEDRKLAEAQKICPVSDHALGSMDAPVAIEVEGKKVWVCCKGCEDPLKADPAKYLAKLEKK